MAADALDPETAAAEAALRARPAAGSEDAAALDALGLILRDTNRAEEAERFEDAAGADAATLAAALRD